MGVIIIRQVLACVSAKQCVHCMQIKGQRAFKPSCLTNKECDFANIDIIFEPLVCSGVNFAVTCRIYKLIPDMVTDGEKNILPFIKVVTTLFFVIKST